MSTVVHDQPVVCTQQEFAHFYPPLGETCQQWAGPYVQQMGGYLQDPANTTLCEYCQYANGDQFVFPCNGRLMVGCISECLLFQSMERLWNIHVRFWISRLIGAVAILFSTF